MALNLHHEKKWFILYYNIYKVSCKNDTKRAKEKGSIVYEINPRYILKGFVNPEHALIVFQRFMV